MNIKTILQGVVIGAALIFLLWIAFYMLVILLLAGLVVGGYFAIKRGKQSPDGFTSAGAEGAGPHYGSTYAVSEMDTGNVIIDVEYIENKDRERRSGSGSKLFTE